MEDKIKPFLVDTVLMDSEWKEIDEAIQAAERRGAERMIELLFQNFFYTANPLIVEVV